MSKTALKFIIFIGFVCLFVFLGGMLNFNPEPLQEFFTEKTPVLSSIIFIVLYVVGTFFIWVGPKDVLRVVSAVVFGAVWSSALIYIAEMLNLLVLFNFSRCMGRAYLEKKMKGKIKKMDEAVSRTSSAAIFFMKFYPIIPFRVLDLGYGLTKVNLSRYFFVSALAAPVRLFVIQYFLALGLDTAMNPMKLQEYLLDRPRVFFAMFTYSVSAVIYLIVLLFRRGRRRDEFATGSAAEAGE
ncbi:MAG: VTT domain-containing protein [Candidatus Omnitrophota bacterium]